LLLGAFFLLSCGGKHPPVPQLRNTRQKFSVQVNVSESANDNSPIAMDFVVVRDKKLMQEVSKLAAKDWFDRRVQFERDFPAQLAVVSWEWVPGQHAGPISIALANKDKFGYIFVNYRNGGDHRAVVDLRSPVVINLGMQDFTVHAIR
jgi:type VI secretion system protein